MWNVAVRCADYGCWKNRSESYGINMIDLRKSAELNGVEPMELYARFIRFPRSGKRVVCYCEMCGKERIIQYHDFKLDHDVCQLCNLRNMSDQWKENLKLANQKKAKDPDWLKTMKNITDGRIDNPGWSALVKIAQNKPGVSEKKSKSMKMSHKDHPEVWEFLYDIDSDRNKKGSAVKQGIPYEEWEDFMYNQVSGRRISSPESIEWRSNIFKRDKYTCQICYQHGVDVNAHHIRKWSEYPELRHDINNGITLCVDCHLETYGKEDEYIGFLEKRLNQSL